MPMSISVKKSILMIPLIKGDQMKQYKVRPSFRGVGDCRRAKGHYTYGLIFESVTEARKIAAAIHKEFKLTVEPRIEFSRRKNKRLMGRATPWTGKIVLFWKGMNVGCLLHELAHLSKEAMAEEKASTTFKSLRLGRGYRMPKRISHGRSFKYAQTKMILFFGKHLRDKFKTRKVDKDVRTLYGEFDFTFSDPSLTTLKRFVGTGHVVHKPITPKPKPKPKKEDPPPLNDEEIIDLIEVTVERISKYAVEGKYITMAGLVRAMRVQGLMNTDSNRAHALKHAESLGLTVTHKF